MKNGWKFWLGLAAGVAAGATAGWFLNSDEGRKVRRDTTRRLSRMTEDVDRTVRRELEDLTIKANEAYERTRAYAEKAKETLKEKVGTFSNS